MFMIRHFGCLLLDLLHILAANQRPDYKHKDGGGKDHSEDNGDNGTGIKLVVVVFFQDFHGDTDVVTGRKTIARKIEWQLSSKRVECITENRRGKAESLIRKGFERYPFGRTRGMQQHFYMIGRKRTVCRILDLLATLWFGFPTERHNFTSQLCHGHIGAPSGKGGNGLPFIAFHMVPFGGRQSFTPQTRVRKTSCQKRVPIMNDRVHIAPRMRRGSQHCHVHVLKRVIGHVKPIGRPDRGVVGLKPTCHVKKVVPSPSG
mmetsp:Transcript_18476/g.29775  ORF Transcript_18476/g.29775 Transcript_18476/m.29775 type:complete len:260 (+) Transcript_18476:163-942(+)